VPGSAPDLGGVVAEQGSGDEAQLAVAAAHDRVGERQRAAVALEVERGLLGAEHPDLERRHARRQAVPEREALHGRAALELVEAGLVTEHRAPERLAEAVAVAVVVAVREDDPLRAGDRVDALERLHRIDQRAGRHVEVGVHVGGDALVERGPVQHAGLDLLHDGTLTRPAAVGSAR
jgi:hypothetical protein